MKEYVIALITNSNDEKQDDILLILKDRPDWQKGKLNLPGGKVEEGETPEQAIVREVKEETGLELKETKLCGTLKDREFTIYCFYGWAYTYDPWINSTIPFKPREGETEECLWIPIDKALLDKRLIPNLRVIIPLIKSYERTGQTGWIVKDDAKKLYEEEHEFKVIVPTYQEQTMYLTFHSSKYRKDKTPSGHDRFLYDNVTVESAHVNGERTWSCGRKIQSQLEKLLEETPVKIKLTKVKDEYFLEKECQ